MTTATELIKQFALDLGYSKAGVSPAVDYAGWVDEIRIRGEEKYGFLTRGKAEFFDLLRIRKRIPEARSILTVAWDYSTRSFPENMRDKIGRIYMARCYDAPAHRINGARLELMKRFLAEQGCAVLSGGFVPERLAGAMAGVATYGRNSFSYVDGVGSFVVLHSLILDKELDYDAPSMECECPPNCSRCKDACPTGALYEDFRVDPSRCIACNNFFTNKKIPGMTDYIPADIREASGTKVHGCDICQEVCPRNQPRLRARLPEDPFLADLDRDFSLASMLHMRGDYYETRMKPILYNYIRDPAYLQRNAAVALGNGGDRGAIPDLAEELDNPHDFVRGHVAWALGKLGGEEAWALLQSRRREEVEPLVLAELDAALGRIETDGTGRQ